MSSLKLEEIVFLIYSCKEYESKRCAVEETWLLGVSDPVYVLDHDPGNIKDLMRIDVTGYDQLSKKTLQMWQRVNEKYGSQKKWFVKIDDDCYLWPDRLLAYLSQFDSTEAWYIGNTMPWYKKKRDSWVNGATYVLSRECVRRLSKALNEETVRNHFCSINEEDVSVGECLKELGVNPTHLDEIKTSLKVREIWNELNTSISIASLSPFRLKMVHRLSATQLPIVKDTLIMTLQWIARIKYFYFSMLNRIRVSACKL